MIWDVMSIESIDRLLTPSELAEILNIKLKTLYQWVELGQIPSLKLAGSVRFNPKDITAWIQSCRKGPAVDYNERTQIVASDARKGGKN
jgi:excisionase family DNA binding protein